MKKLLTMLVLMMAFSANVDAQGWLKKLKDKAVEKVKEKVEREVDDATADVLEGKKPSSKKSMDGDDGDAEMRDDTPAANTQTSYNNYDFVPGSQIIYEDNMQGEQLGEFPSKWDIFKGNAEIAQINGEKCIMFQDGEITPLFKDNKVYLTDECTVEFDVFFREENVWNKEYHGDNWAAWHEMQIKLPRGNTIKEFVDHRDCSLYLQFQFIGENGREEGKKMSPSVYYNWKPTSMANSDDGRDCREGEYKLKGVQTEQWHHIAISFNKRAYKVYFDKQRIANIPNAVPPTYLTFTATHNSERTFFIKNIRIAKGAVALYNRDTSDADAISKAIAETGKFVTNNILFETAKATLKPESMTEIQKVAEYMKKNPTVRFEVQGHTDNQGSDKVNDPLSQQRAEAVVKALEGLGVDGFNLRAVGRGSHDPVADNSTEEGRAKNRRVEFIKR